MPHVMIMNDCPLVCSQERELKISGVIWLYCYTLCMYISRLEKKKNMREPFPWFTISVSPGLSTKPNSLVE